MHGQLHIAHLVVPALDGREILGKIVSQGAATSFGTELSNLSQPQGDFRHSRFMCLSIVQVFVPKNYVWNADVCPSRQSKLLSSFP